ncbi:MAG: glycosyltransferase [Candidatus Micrarchaeota archaeon]|nr:glycosyltransferase [Candidatus Micrarchaeota archaeon]
MRITIGICTKNSEKTIGDTIHSILTQDFFKYHSMENVEIIVVDANSRDKTIEVIKNSLSNHN